MPQNYSVDIDKRTVDFIPNFDDTSSEPTVLPATFPNLLVNGSTGISAGYATDIPPHNLREVIDAVIYRMDHPGCSVDELMNLYKVQISQQVELFKESMGLKKPMKREKGKLLFAAKRN